MLAEIMEGNASEAQIAAFLIALRTKGETEDELAGLAQTMRALATPVRPERDGPRRHGRHRRRTARRSTSRRRPRCSPPAAGCAVAKHGNRSATRLSGSADVLEALGARLDVPPEGVARQIDEAGFGFMFAPAHHAATRHVVPVRKAARRPHDLQPARPADEPGRRAAPGRRRRRPGRRSTSSRARWRAWGPTGRW